MSAFDFVNLAHSVSVSSRGSLTYKNGKLKLGDMLYIGKILIFVSLNFYLNVLQAERKWASMLGLPNFLVLPS